MLGPYNSAQPAGLKVAASRRNTGDTLHTGKVVKLMDKASFPQCTDSVNRDVREALSTRRRPRVVEGREVRMQDLEVLVLCVSVLYIQIGVRFRRTYVLQHILFLKSNVFLQTPDPQAGVHRSYEIPEQQRTSSW